MLLYTELESYYASLVSKCNVSTMLLVSLYN